LSNRKNSWIDYNAYKIIESTDTKSIADDFFAFVLKIASGDMKAKNEINGYRDIAIFKDGVTL
jgi:altronate hydrolase